MSEKKPRKKTGGRKPGSLNRKTIIGKNVSETLKAWLGFDDESVARTGQIDGEGYRGRLALREMWEDRRPIDPQYIALAKFLFSYAYGQPGKMPVEGIHRESLVFATTHGHLPWSQLAPEAARMDARSAALNAAKDEEIKMLAREAEKPVVIDAKAVEDDAVAETLESVNPDDPSAFGGGGRGR